MSTTRYAKPGSPLSQERFASSYEHGLLANLVAKRCAEIDPPADRAPIWFAQWQSWQFGGITNLVYELLKEDALAEWRANQGEHMPWGELIMHTGKELPSYLEREIEELCLDPKSSLVDVWTALDAYREKWIAGRPTIAETTISRRVEKALDYTQSARILTLIDGHARIGKSFSARAWCERSAGLARYVQVPCSNDEIAFYRAIGQALGVSSHLQLKAAEIRARVEMVLQTGDLMLVFDEAHYCWPQVWQRYAMPTRINWIMTALVNNRVPVAMVTTPQFYACQKRVEKLTGWASEQFIGRIGHLERLPAKLQMDDLMVVAKALLPGGDTKTWRAMAAYADLSGKHLASMEAIVKRATWLAGQDGRSEPTAVDVRLAMKESIMPSDTALVESLAAARKEKRNDFARAPREAGGLSAMSARRDLLSV